MRPTALRLPAVGWLLAAALALGGCTHFQRECPPSELLANEQLIDLSAEADPTAGNERSNLLAALHHIKANQPPPDPLARRRSAWQLP